MIYEDNESYAMAIKLYEEVFGYPPKIIEGKVTDELIVAGMQKGIVHGANYQESKTLTEDKTITLLISCKDRFSGSGMDDYHTDKEVIDWYEDKKKLNQ